MDALTELENEKNKVLSGISRAAGEGKTDLVLSESKKLEQIELMINRHLQLVLELKELRSNKSNVSTIPRSVKKART